MFFFIFVGYSKDNPQDADLQVKERPDSVLGRSCCSSCAHVDYALARGVLSVRETHVTVAERGVLSVRDTHVTVAERLGKGDKRDLFKFDRARRDREVTKTGFFAVFPILYFGEPQFQFEIFYKIVDCAAVSCLISNCKMYVNSCSLYPFNDM